MISWVILLVVCVGGIWWLSYLIKNWEFDFAPFVIMSGLILAVSAVIVCHSYYYDKLAIQLNYQKVNTNIKEVKELISNKTLNLADTDMNKKLAELVIEKNWIIYVVKENNISPFSLFKIKLK